jgi:hypothetical protein
MNTTAFNVTNASDFFETPLNFNVPLVASRLNREARINAEVAKRREELEDKAEVERRLKEAIEMSNLEKERRKEEEERRRIELHEEELRRASERAETSDGYDSDISRMTRSLERERAKAERRERRRRGEAVPSSSEEDSLTNPFRNMARVVGNMNENLVSDDERKRKNREYLERIGTRGDIRRAFRKSLAPAETALEERFARILAEQVGQAERKIMDKLDEEVFYRLDRIEDNERLTTRAAVEKCDEVKPNLFYPRNPCDEDTYRKALIQLNSRVKILEKSMTFKSDPFNFAQSIASESNTVAKDFSLSKLQQRALILSYLPNTEPQFRVLSLEGTLEGVMKTISTVSSAVMTRTGLERAINEWTLNVSSENALNQSLFVIIDLLNKVREDFGSPPDIPRLLRDVISRIHRMPNIPRVIREKLYEARLRIRDEDTLSEGIKIIVSVCLGWVQIKSSNPKVKNVTADLSKLTMGSSGPAGTGKKKKAEAKAVVAPMVDSKPVKTGPPPKKEKDGGGGFQKAQPASNSKGSAKPPQNDGQKKFKKASFVKAWPAGVPYLSKNGNCLSKDIETHFRNHCHKCGHGSHNADKCRTYQDKATILTLCTRCRQGFHDECRSKRPDLVQAKMAKEVKKMMAGQYAMAAAMPAPFMWPYAAQPQPPFSKNKAAASESDDE